MPPALHSRRAACVLLWTLVLACGDDDVEAVAERQTVQLDVGVPAAEPAPAVLPELPPPPEDPWAAEGLEALRNGEDLGWPVEAVHITSGFGWRVDPVENTGTRLHRGTDFRGDVGDPVLSIAAGTVSFAGFDPVLGTMVVVDHGLGITSLYGHMSDLLVWPGASVERGAALGLVGNTGRSAAAHLHLTVKIDDVAVDPMMVLGQPLHRATALRGLPPRTYEAPADTPGAQDDPASAPVLQP